MPSAYTTAMRRSLRLRTTGTATTGCSQDRDTDKGHHQFTIEKSGGDLKVLLPHVYVWIMASIALLNEARLVLSMPLWRMLDLFADQACSDVKELPPVASR